MTSAYESYESFFAFNNQANNETQEAPLYQETMTQGKKSFKCLAPNCQKTYRFKSDMERHIVIHSTQKNCVCTFPKCGKSFKRPDALKNHMQAHAENNIFICPMPDCNAQFHKKNILQYHLAKHQILQNFISNEGQQENSRPFKRVRQWEKEWCAQQKATVKDNNQHYSSNESYKDLSDNETEITSIYSEEPAQTKIFIGETGYVRNQSALPLNDFSEVSSVISGADNASSTGSNAQDFLQTLCLQLAKENQELRNQLSDKIDLVQTKYGQVPETIQMEAPVNFAAFENIGFSAFENMF